MADNNRSRLIPCTMIERLALVVIAVLSTSFSLVIAIIILFIAILRPSAPPEAATTDTTRIEIDINLDHGLPSEQHLRERHPRHYRRRPSPHPAAHARRYPLYQPYYHNVPAADDGRSLSRTPSPIRTYQPLFMHTAQQENTQYTAGVYPLEGHLPSPLPIVATDGEDGAHPPYDEPLPPAHSDDGWHFQYTTLANRRPRRPQSTPIYARKPEEHLPVYERPPEYDAEHRGSQ